MPRWRWNGGRGPWIDLPVARILIRAMSRCTQGPGPSPSRGGVTLLSIGPVALPAAILLAADESVAVAARSIPAQTEGGWVGLSPWLLVMGIGLLGACLACLWQILQRMGEQVTESRRAADELVELRERVTRWVGDRESLDLRRIEHVLVDVRDGQQRVEDVLLRTVELATRPAREAETPTTSIDPDALVERITNRLLALGYDRVQVVTSRAELEVLPLEGRGEVLVEARRGGVAHKGRVLLNGGRIADIDMQPPYAMFP